MSFTYDPTLADPVSVIRFYIGDTIENQGPRTNNLNFADEEINAVLARVSDNVNAAIADLFGVLTADWDKYAVSYTIGPRKEELFRISARFKEQSDSWGAIAGTKNKTFSSGMVRSGSNADSGHVT